MQSKSSPGPYSNANDDNARVTTPDNEGVIYTLNRVASTVADNVEAARENVSNVTNATAQQIRRNPIQSTLIALGVGFIVGKLLR